MHIYVIVLVWSEDKQEHIRIHVILGHKVSLAEVLCFIVTPWQMIFYETRLQPDQINFHGHFHALLGTKCWITRCIREPAPFPPTPLKELKGRQFSGQDNDEPSSQVNQDVGMYQCTTLARTIHTFLSSREWRNELIWCDMEVCPYCKVKIKNQKKEHLKIHKTLKHKVLPVQFQTVSLANSALPLIQDFFRPLDSSTKL